MFFYRWQQHVYVHTYPYGDIVVPAKERGRTEGEKDNDDNELRQLLEAVSDRGLKTLSLDELERLQALLQAKSYPASNKKAASSRKKLLKQINFEIYGRHSPRRFF